LLLLLCNAGHFLEEWFWLPHAKHTLSFDGDCCGNEDIVLVHDERTIANDTSGRYCFVVDVIFSKVFFCWTTCSGFTGLVNGLLREQLAGRRRTRVSKSETTVACWC